MNQFDEDETHFGAHPASYVSWDLPGAGAQLVVLNHIMPKLPKEIPGTQARFCYLSAQIMRFNLKQSPRYPLALHLARHTYMYICVCIYIRENTITKLSLSPTSSA